MNAAERFFNQAVALSLLGPEQAESYHRAYFYARQSGSSTPLPEWLVARGLISEPQRAKIIESLSPSQQNIPTFIIPVEDSEDEDRDAESLGSLSDHLKSSPLNANLKRTTARGLCFGPYVIESEIARGGMGAVYRAYHPKHEDPLALKVLLSRDRPKPRQLKRFRREIETIRRLDHEGIVKIVDAGHIDNIDYLTMEYLEGDPLTVALDRAEFDEGELCRIIRDLARALQHAHDHGVIHRDLKPANIIQRPSGQIVITDFGLAKDLFDSAVLSLSGTVIGTPRYLSPEQVNAQHDRIGPATDIYALGVMLYEGLTDTRPFDADSMEALYQKIESAPPTDPRTLKPELSDDLAELCLSAMAKEQELRPASCRELANALDSYLSCGQIKTPRRSPKARLNRATAKVRALVPQRRADRAMLGLLGLLLALLLVLSGLAALNDPGEAPPAPPSERPRRGAR